jgi:hypothetical protein
MKRYIVYIIAVLWVMAFVWQSIAHADSQAFSSSLIGASGSHFATAVLSENHIRT